MSKRFIFPLQQVLDLRKMQKDQAALELAQAEMELKNKSKAVDDLHAELGVAEQRQQDQQGILAGELWLWLRYKERILHDIDQAQIEKQQQVQKVQDCRKQLAEKNQEMKKMERLKEKQALEHEQEQALQEQKELDEMGSLLYQKRDF